jgi:hypothetical protein
VSETSQGPGWWVASDGKWYPPGSNPQAQLPTPLGSPEPEEPQVGGQGGGEGHFGDGITAPLYEFQASKLKSGRWFSPNVIRVWRDRIEEYEHHAVRKKGTQAINFFQVAQVKLDRGMRWSNVTVESTGGHVITLKGVPKADGERVKGLIDEAVHAARIGVTQREPTPASAPPAVVSVADELMKLAQLRDAGVLSAEEFESQKARVMQPPS